MADAPMAYCVKCRTKREIKDPVQVTMSNGRPATQGSCPVCGTKLFRIGSGSAAAAAATPEAHTAHAGKAEAGDGAEKPKPRARKTAKS